MTEYKSIMHYINKLCRYELKMAASAKGKVGVLNIVIFALLIFSIFGVTHLGRGHGGLELILDHIVMSDPHRNTHKHTQSFSMGQLA